MSRRQTAGAPDHDLGTRAWRRSSRSGCEQLVFALHQLADFLERLVERAGGVNGLRKQRAAPSSSAMRRKSGAGESRLAKAYPDIATRGIAGARSWNTLIDSKPRMCGMKMSTSIRSKEDSSSARSPASPPSAIVTSKP